MDFDGVGDYCLTPRNGLIGRFNCAGPGRVLSAVWCFGTTKTRVGCRGRSGRRLFQPAALPPSRASSTALGGIAADAVASGSRLDDLHRAAVAGVGAVAVLHGGPRCGE